MDLNLRFREKDERGTVELTGSYRLAAVLADALCPKVKRIISAYRKYNRSACEMANVNITNWIIENGADKDSHVLMIYCELIETYNLPDIANANEGY